MAFILINIVNPYHATGLLIYLLQTSEWLQTSDDNLKMKFRKWKWQFSSLEMKVSPTSVDNLVGT